MSPNQPITRLEGSPDLACSGAAPRRPDKSEGFLWRDRHRTCAAVRNEQLDTVIGFPIVPHRIKKEPRMAKMTKTQLIDAIAESSSVSKNDVKAVIEHMATVGYKELNESGEFVIPGFVKMSVVNKPATEARSGINPFTKEPMEFAAKPASKSVKASPLKVAKDAV
jgi:DNA-binding protein HU-beta